MNATQRKATERNGTEWYRMEMERNQTALWQSRDAALDLLLLPLLLLLLQLPNHLRLLLPLLSETAGDSSILPEAKRI